MFSFTKHWFDNYHGDFTSCRKFQFFSNMFSIIAVSFNVNVISICLYQRSLEDTFMNNIIVVMGILYHDPTV